MSDLLVQLSVQVDDRWYGSKTSEDSSVELGLQTKVNDGAFWCQATFVNRSDKPVRLGSFRFDLPLFADVPGTRIRLYREGWTMTSACASVRYGDTDFPVDPDYLPYAVTDPNAFTSDTPNHFFGEHVIVLNDSQTSACVLAGFISSADQMTRFEVKLTEQGIEQCTAYSMGDGRWVEPGQSICSEELIIMQGSDGYGLLEDFADRWAKRMNAITWDHVPTGWCSWYYYFSNVTEQDIVENIDYLAAHRDEFPMEFIQLDEGYQAALGDWLTCNNKFPNGLPYLAQKAQDAGFKPGIWLAPFMVEKRSELFKAHPDWMVHDADGKIVQAGQWRGHDVVVLDGTHPDALDYLHHVFTSLVSWGYEYVKLDFLVYACLGAGGHYHDPHATRAHALRRGLQVIRDAMVDRLILGCTAPLGQAIGLVNAERISTDITPYWQPDRKIYKEAPTVPNVCRNIINRSYTNGRLWISDPDTHIAREDNNKLTENEVFLWTSALLLSGGTMMLSDRFETLSPKRAELSKLLLSKPGIGQTRPLDFFENEYPTTWLRRDSDSTSCLLGLFNFELEPKTIAVAMDQIASNCSFKVEDYWTKQTWEHKGSILKLNVAPHSCRLLRLLPLV